jgi:hypothetical protein
LEDPDRELQVPHLPGEFYTYADTYSYSYRHGNSHRHSHSNSYSDGSTNANTHANSITSFGSNGLIA